MTDTLKIEQIAAMAIAAIAEESNEKIENLRICFLREVSDVNSLDKYLREHQIAYRKYQLGDEQNE